MNIKSLIIIGIFASLWSSVELFVGSFLHSFSLQAFPFINPTGLVMLFFALTILTVLHFKVPKFGAITLAALLTAIIKLFGFAHVKIVPPLAILTEGLIFDVLINLCGMKKNKFFILLAAFITGVLGTGLFSSIGYFLMGWFSGRTIYFVAAILLVSSLKGAIGATLGTLTGLKIINQLDAKNK